MSQLRHTATSRKAGRAVRFRRTVMTDAILSGADLRGVDLRCVRGLTLGQLRAARMDARTRLPFRLKLVLTIDRLVKKCRISR